MNSEVEQQTNQVPTPTRPDRTGPDWTGPGLARTSTIGVCSASHSNDPTHLGVGSGALLPLNHFQFVLGVILANLFANFCSKMIVFGVNPKVSP